MFAGGGSTVIPDPDHAALDAFWRRWIEVRGPGAETWTDATCFGDTPELANELIALVLHGPKRATAGSRAEYEAESVAIPAVGDEWIALDGAARPRAILRTSDVRVGPLSSVDDVFAWDEGEGDRTRASWLRGHTTYFTRAYDRLGLNFDPHIDVVFERFELAYAEPGPHEPNIPGR